MGILVNENQIGGGGTSNSSHNIGDIFYTTRTDNFLNGAVECNGSQYNFSDFDSNLQTLFDDGKLPYITIDEFDAMVTEQGGCDSFGYKTSNMIQIYPIGNDTEPAQMYIELTDQQFESFYTTLDQCNKSDILPYRLYDIDTKELLEGYYIKCTFTGFFQAYDNNNEEFGYFVDIPIFQPEKVDGEWVYYETIPDPDKSHASPTTYFKVPKKLSRVLVRTQKPTAANNYTWYNIYADGWCEQGGKITLNGIISDNNKIISLPVRMESTKYYSIVSQDANAGGTPRVTVGWQSTTKMTVGFVSTGGVNGQVSWEVKGYADLSEYLKNKWDYQNIQVERCMIQLFNSTTDTAVATCNQVLSDISTLNQGDYVVYWDSYELSDHSHAYTGITLDEYQWYRIYKSGWVEQGGKQNIIVPANRETVRKEISLPIEMNNANYNTQLTQEQKQGAVTIAVAKRYENATSSPSTPTTLSIIAQNNISIADTADVNYMWQVSGFSFLA